MQIKADLSVADGKRIEKIIKTYGFKSVYEFAKAVVMVFIKANDPREDEILTENLKEIFTQQVDTKIKHNHETKPEKHYHMENSHLPHNGDHVKTLGSK